MVDILASTIVIPLKDKVPHIQDIQAVAIQAVLPVPWDLTDTRVPKVLQVPTTTMVVHPAGHPVEANMVTAPVHLPAHPPAMTTGAGGVVTRHGQALAIRRALGHQERVLNYRHRPRQCRRLQQNVN
jgi:hypothetical protein